MKSVQVREPLLSSDEMDAVLGAYRTMTGLAARSLAGTGTEVTLPQYRLLTLLCLGGRHRVVDLAQQLDVTSPNATRMCSRLVDKRLVRREPSETDRRVVEIWATDAGRDLVARVSEAHRADLESVLARMPAQSRAQLAPALAAFAQAADMSGAGSPAWREEAP